ncbi:MAG: hypothetical protein AB7I96_06715 [Candidatus Dadabacteria bacterium]
MRTKRFFYILLIVFSFLLSLPGTVLWAQSKDDEIKLIKQQIEVLSRRLEELEGQKAKQKSSGTVTRDNVAFYNTAIDRNMRKLTRPDSSRTILNLSGNGTVSLMGDNDPNRVNAVLAPMVNHRITDNLRFIFKPEVKLLNEEVGFRIGMGELDFFLNDYITLRGGKIQNAALVSPAALPSWLGDDPIAYSLSRREESLGSQDLISELKNMGVGISGGIPLNLFDRASLNYGVSYMNSANGSGTMNFSFSISRP